MLCFAYLGCADGIGAGVHWCKEFLVLAMKVNAMGLSIEQIDEECCILKPLILIRLVVVRSNRDK